MRSDELTPLARQAVREGHDKCEPFKEEAHGAVTNAGLEKPAQETDAWWGAYSGWAMMPSMALCLCLTGLIVWGSWWLLEKGWVQLGAFTLAGAVWIVQTFRWCYRVFGFNYRLTTRRLFQNRGILYDAVEVNLADVVNVEVRQTSADRLAGVGSIYLILNCPSHGVKSTSLPAQPMTVLYAVPQAEQVAEQIRKLSERARRLEAAPDAS